MRTAGYVRVSTERQADLGISLEAQKAKIRAMATVRGDELEEVIVDGGESAKDLNRTGVQRLLELVENGKIGRGHRGQARPAHPQRQGPVPDAGAV
jgi:DNA invertase Pin-like site-specific DNA recombinase